MTPYEKQLEYQQKVAEYMRNRYSEPDMSEKVAYEEARKRMQVDLPEYQERDPYKPTMQNIYEYPKEDLNKVDASRGAWDSVLSTFSAADFVARNFDSDFAKEAYNNSSAGLLHQAIYGNPKYAIQPDEEDDTWIGARDEAGQFLLGLLNPVDMAGFFLSGGLGGMAARGAGAKWFTNTALKGIQNNAGKKAAANQLRGSAIISTPISFTNPMYSLNPLSSALSNLLLK